MYLLLLNRLKLFNWEILIYSKTQRPSLTQGHLTKKIIKQRKPNLLHFFEPQQEEKIDMQKLDGKERIALLKKRKEDMKAKM